MEVDEEIEAVVAVYNDDVLERREGKMTGSKLLRIRINPDTAGHEALIHASMVVSLVLEADYPQVSPAVEFESVGLGDQVKEQMLSSVEERCSELAGEACLFEILSVCKDFVNKHNVPQDDCSICMCGFEDGDPCVKASCTHSFHSDCLARWVHDQRVQSEEKRNRKDNTTERNEVGEGGKDGVFEASCAVCRQPIQQDRLEMLQPWLIPLREAHVKEQEEARRMEQNRRVQAEATEAARREQERRDKERKEMLEFQVKPLIVIDYYEHSNLKLLKHAMLPLGALDCRIVKSGSGDSETLTAAVWFPCLEKAERAARSQGWRARLANYQDSKFLPPDFVNR